MKVLLLVAALFSFNVFADHHEEGKTFEQIKAHKLEKIEKRLAGLNEHKSCISAATTKEALKACKDKAQAKRQEWKGKRK